MKMSLVIGRMAGKGVQTPHGDVSLMLCFLLGGSSYYFRVPLIAL